MKRLTLALLAAAAVAVASPAVASPLDGAPADTMMALHVDAKRLLQAPVVKRALDKMRNTPDFQKGMKDMQSKVGFNPEKDLASLTIFVPANVSKSKRFTLVATGTFDVKKATAEASRDKNFTKKTIAGQSAFVGKDGMGLIISAKKVVMGHSSTLSGAWAGKAGGSAALKSLTKNVDTGKAVWFAVNLPAEMKKEMAQSNPMGKDLQSLTGSLDLASGLALALNLGTAKAGTAQNLAKMANMQIAQAAKQQNPMFKAMGFDAVLAKLKVAAKGSDVTVGLKLTDAEVSKLENALGMMMMGMGGAKAAPPAKK